MNVPHRSVKTEAEHEGQMCLADVQPRPPPSRRPLAVFFSPRFTSSPRPLLETHKSPLALHSSFPPSIHLSLLSSCLRAASLTHIKRLGSRRGRYRPLLSLLPPLHFPAPALNTRLCFARSSRESARPSPVKTHF